MSERLVKNIHKKLDRIQRYAAREDTRVAHVLSGLSSQEGEAHRSSLRKEIADRTLAGILALGTLPIQAAIAYKIYKGKDGPILYSQERLGRDGKLQKITKFRTLRVGSDPDGNTVELASQYGQGRDPRATELGCKLRKSSLDELPQLWDVVRGRLSFVGIRLISPYAHDHMALHRKRTVNEWDEAYAQGDPGLIHLNHLANKKWPKNDAKRHHYDMIYARRASLGMDLYILTWLVTETIRKMLPEEVETSD